MMNIVRRYAVWHSAQPAFIFVSLVFILFVNISCSLVRAPTPEELALLDNPPEAVKAKQDWLTPLALQWLNATELDLLGKGQPLSKDDMSMAQAVGVQHPGRVRVVVLEQLPMPSNEALLNEATKYGLGSDAEGARTMGYVIMVKKKYAGERWILAHELAHVAQQEQRGREAFVRRFIAERELMGYRRAPLELEANRLALEFM
jgi:hypothetical protein